MKVLINASIIGDELNGLGVYSVEVIKRLLPLLDSSNIDFDVYCYKKKFVNFLPDEKVSLIRLRRFDNFFLKISPSLHRIIWNKFTLKRLIKNYDLVYSPSSHGCTGAANQIVTVHDLICLTYPRQNIFQYLYYRFFLKSILKKSLVVAISNYTKNEIYKHFSFKEEKFPIQTIYNGADHLIKDKSQKHGDTNVVLEKFGLTSKKFFLAVGATYPHKNILRLIEAAREFESTNYTFVIVGGGGYLRSIRDKVSELSLTNVILLTRLSNAELAILYNECLINVYISLLEGFGFPPIEAAFYNTISVVANSSCLPEVYGDAAIYVDPTNTQDIVTTFNKIIDGKIRVEDFTSKLLGLSQKYKWDFTVERIFQIISSNILLK